MSESPYEVIASVSPRSAGGTSLFETTETITADSVDRFHSKVDDVRDAKRALQTAGFHIFNEASTDTTISIGGTTKLFKEYFGAKLKKQKTDIGAGQELEFMASGDAPDEPILAAPSETSDLIEGAVIARPPIYFAPAPIPPLAPIHPAAYRYLMVPDEVAVTLRASRTHRMGATGKNVVVAMIDTGHYRHPFFTEHGYRLYKTLLGPGAIDASQDANGHGTGESANIFACAPDCRLRPVKMAADTVGAINVAVGSSPTPRIVTNSWGYDIDRSGASLPASLRPLEAAIANAVAKGITMMFSAGNGHRAFPASHPDVIAIGGVHVNYPDLTFEASSYASSFVSSIYPGRRVPDVCGLTGNAVNIGGNKAPSLMLPVQEGASLDGIDPSSGSGRDGWGLFSGTSASCPQAAGVVALMLERNPALNPAGVKQRLMDSARDVTSGSTRMGDAAGPGNDLATGAGLIDAKWAYLRSMGDVAVSFFSAPREQQLAMLESGKMPEISSEFVDDLVDTLRSR